MDLEFKLICDLPTDKESVAHCHTLNSQVRHNHFFALRKLIIKHNQQEIYTRRGVELLIGLTLGSNINSRYR